MNGFDSPRSRDPAIKLFGREIPLPENQIPTKPKSMETNFGKMKMDTSMPLPNMKQEQKASTEPRDAQLDNRSNPKDDHQIEADDSDQEKSFKKPDNILPCPRCNSLETKFCYFNNYNVNQPRYYCKNCQRYWTAGGTMRNVPVGAGRRRNKQFAIASQYRQILDGSAVSNVESSESANDQTGKFLKFGSEVPLCESMDAVLQLKDQKKHEKENQQQVSAIGSSSSMVSSIQNNGISQTSLSGSCNNANTQNSFPIYPVPPWGFPLSPIWNNIATAIQSNGNSNPNAVQFCSGPATAIHRTTFAQNIPLQFVPVSYVPILGNLSWTASNGNSQSAALGKHSREPSCVMEEKQSEDYSLVPKSLRIDDHPTVVSKSFPVWVTTGLASKESKGAIFKGLEHKMEETHVLEANPAAFSRSQTFQERT